MKKLSVALLTLTFVLVGCGVKGKPLPPTTTPVLGRGEPNFSKATENVKLKKKSSKPSSDWEDGGDFPEDK